MKTIKLWLAGRDTASILTTSACWNSFNNCKITRWKIQGRESGLYQERWVLESPIWIWLWMYKKWKGLILTVKAKVNCLLKAKKLVSYWTNVDLVLLRWEELLPKPVAQHPEQQMTCQLFLKVSHVLWKASSPKLWYSLGISLVRVTSCHPISLNRALDSIQNTTGICWRL